MAKEYTTKAYKFILDGKEYAARVTVAVGKTMESLTKEDVSNFRMAPIILALATGEKEETIETWDTDMVLEVVQDMFAYYGVKMVPGEGRPFPGVTGSADSP